MNANRHQRKQLREELKRLRTARRQSNATPEDAEGEERVGEAEGGRDLVPRPGPVTYVADRSAEVRSCREVQTDKARERRLLKETSVGNTLGISDHRDTLASGTGDHRDTHAGSNDRPTTPSSGTGDHRDTHAITNDHMDTHAGTSDHRATHVRTNDHRDTRVGSGDHQDANVENMLGTQDTDMEYRRLEINKDPCVTCTTTWDNVHNTKVDKQSGQSTLALPRIPSLGSPIGILSPTRLSPTTSSPVMLSPTRQTSRTLSPRILSPLPQSPKPSSPVYTTRRAICLSPSYSHDGSTSSSDDTDSYRAQRKKVHFAPDTRDITLEERKGPVKRVPKPSALQQLPEITAADQLPAVVEKYMIRSLPLLPPIESPQSATETTTATTNVIFIKDMKVKVKQRVGCYSNPNSHGNKKQIHCTVDKTDNNGNDKPQRTTYSRSSHHRSNAGDSCQHCGAPKRQKDSSSNGGKYSSRSTCSCERNLNNNGSTSASSCGSDEEEGEVVDLGRRLDGFSSMVLAVKSQIEQCERDIRHEETVRIKHATAEQGPATTLCDLLLQPQRSRGTTHKRGSTKERRVGPNHVTSQGVTKSVHLNTYLTNVMRARPLADQLHLDDYRRHLTGTNSR